MTDDRVTCLICDKRFNSVGRHVYVAHGILAVEYRDQFGIRRSATLSSPSCRALASASLKALHASGRLDAHLAGNAERARGANVLALAEKRVMQAAGIEFPKGRPEISEQVLEPVVLAIEAGVSFAAALRQATLAASTFHGALKRHPDLRRRVDAAKRRRWPQGRLISRAEARAAGMTRFFTGVPCHAGHVAERRIGAGDCVECCRLGRAQRRTERVSG